MENACVSPLTQLRRRAKFTEAPVRILGQVTPADAFEHAEGGRLRAAGDSLLLIGCGAQVLGFSRCVEPFPSSLCTASKGSVTSPVERLQIGQRERELAMAGSMPFLCNCQNIKGSSRRGFRLLRPLDAAPVDRFQQHRELSARLWGPVPLFIREHIKRPRSSRLENRHSPDHRTIAA